MANRLRVVDEKGDRSEYTLKDSSAGDLITYKQDQQITSDAAPQARWELFGGLKLIEERIGDGLPNPMLVFVESSMPGPQGPLPASAWGCGSIFRYILKFIHPSGKAPQTQS